MSGEIIASKKDRLINGMRGLPFLSLALLVATAKKTKNALEDVAQVTGT
jgi:hypothetical protein